HGRGGLLQRPVRRRHDDVTRQVVVHDLDIDLLSRGEGVHDVALGEDAGLVVLRVENYDGANLAGRHAGRRLTQRVVGAESKDLVTHRFADLHDALPDKQRMAPDGPRQALTRYGTGWRQP